MKQKMSQQPGRPEDSVYYHPTLNPTGAPPPGKSIAPAPSAAGGIPGAMGQPAIPVPKPPPLPKGPNPNQPSTSAAAAAPSPAVEAAPSAPAIPALPPPPGPPPAHLTGEMGQG